jgi:hypothetical protein
MTLSVIQSSVRGLCTRRSSLTTTYAATREEIETRPKSFIRKWRLKHRAVAESLEEAGDRPSSALCYLERRARQILLE